MRFKKALIAALIMVAALASPAASDGPNLDDMTGSQIREDLQESFKDESLGYINPTTGMSPGAEEGSGYSPPTGSGTPWSDVSGRWILNLVDTESRSLNLTLYQYGNEVFGRGMMVAGANTQELTAAGSTEGSALYLRLVTVGGDNMYRLRTVVSGNSIFGPYSAYTSYGDTWAGNCDGIRFYATNFTFPEESSGTVAIGSAASGS
ncbi:MAG TPA: hypothetical protein PLZ42_00130 [Methanothrix sp.]|nr:hypothetical protein [Methanothrix sp.]